MDGTNTSISAGAVAAAPTGPPCLTNIDVRTRVLRKGDLVRIQKICEPRLKNYDGALGRVVRSIPIPPEELDETHFDLVERHALLYDIDFVLGGKVAKIHRREMHYTTAEVEGMITDGNSARGKRKRKPSTIVLEAAADPDPIKKKKCGPKKKNVAAAGAKKNGKAAPKSAAKKAAKKSTVTGKRKVAGASSKADSSKKAKQVVVAPDPLEDDAVISKDLYEKHRKDFERSFIRLEKLDQFGFFFEELPEEATSTMAAASVPEAVSAPAVKSEPSYTNPSPPKATSSAVEVQSSATPTLPPQQQSAPPETVPSSGATSVGGQDQEADAVPSSSTVPPQPTDNATPVSASVPCTDVAAFVNPFAKTPLTWYHIRERRDAGRYVIDRMEKLERNRKKRLGPYMWDRRKKRKQLETEGTKKVETWELHEIATTGPSKGGKRSLKRNGVRVHPRVLHPKGVDWDLFRSDVIAMCDAVAARDSNGVDGGPGTPGHSARKTKAFLEQIYQKTAKKHMSEMESEDARHEFTVLLNAKDNAAAAMQGAWRTTPFPEREYERLREDAVCAGLSPLDERTATHEKLTSLPDSFVGLAYSYNDTGESEGWMKSVFESTKSKSKKKDGLTEEQRAANALATDDGVVRAQVRATMRTLLIGVQDRVLTDAGVLKDSELRSANWGPPTPVATALQSSATVIVPTEPLVPDLVEQSVWGMDCYTRQNVLICTEKDLDPETAVEFLEKWLLPAINACPVDLAHDLTNAAKILEGLPLQSVEEEEAEPMTAGQTPPPGDKVAKASEKGPKNDPKEMWSHSLIGKALMHKMKYSGPPWLAAAAYQLRRAIKALGQDFFRVHPKGHGSIVLSPTVKANTLVTFYHGEIYPSWRWGEKLDAIEMTQQHLSLRPNLPDFYNMALERPQADPRGYGLMIVDASRKAGHGSMLSHSCDPTCEVRVAALNGQLCLAMTTLREIEQGEELTFDYNAVTESLEEYQAAICLCGYSKCRGSFLHFATADCYQQVLNRNSPIAVRFANLVKGCTKEVMSEEDQQTLGTHGFGTAAFGAVSFNRNSDLNASNGIEPLDSTNNIPVWLRTYVADVLRYIEYERRALPIALLCDHFKADKATQESNEKEKPSPKSAKKEKKAKSGEEKGKKVEDQKDNDTDQEGNEPKELDGKEHEEKTLKKSKRATKDAESLNLSKISFEAADAEGVSAMEQRIQQLTQALSRIGRVLNRHREKDLVAEPKGKFGGEIHAPLSIMTDHEVVSWMWCHDRGVVKSLFRSIETEKCADPSLYKSLLAVKMKFESLDNFVLNRGDSGLSSLEARKILSAALIAFRNCLNDGVQELAKQFKSYELQRNRAKAQVRRDSVKLAMKMEVKLVLLDIVDQVVRRAKDSETEVDESNAIDGSTPELALLEEEKPNLVEITKNPWLEHYQDRWKLEAAADILLLHARTSTFFKIVPYMQLESTPLEVYARELGNKIPRSKIKRVQDSDVEKSTNIVLLEEPSVDDGCDMSETSRANDKMNDSERSRGGKKKGSSTLCDPDEAVANVTVKYTGDYVMSQLLQWFNGGVGQKQGLPDMVGCVILPSVEATLLSSATFSGRAKKTSTIYRSQLRPRLFDWLRDHHQRGSAFPDELTKVFNPPELVYTGEGLEVLPLGSPILDLLVMGEDANINLVLAALDEDRLRDLGANASTDSAANRLESTVDEGMPVQAVAKWVQCENEDCLKWRRLPFFVDLDVLPEQFFCKENVWNPKAQSCDAQEDTWDQNDANVQNGGVAKDSDKQMMAYEEEGNEGRQAELAKYEIGSRFDIMRVGKNYYCTGEVVDSDFKSDTKKVKLHFPKTPEKFDEWIEITSLRIAPFNSKQVSKKDRQKAKAKEKADKIVLQQKTAPKGVKAAPKVKEKKPDAAKPAPDPKLVVASLLALRNSIPGEGQGKLANGSHKPQAKETNGFGTPKAITAIPEKGHRTIDAFEDTDSDEERTAIKAKKAKQARVVQTHGETSSKSREDGHQTSSFKKKSNSLTRSPSPKKAKVSSASSEFIPRKQNGTGPPPSAIPRKPKEDNPYHGAIPRKPKPDNPRPGAIPRKPKVHSSPTKLKALTNTTGADPSPISRKVSSSMPSPNHEHRIPRKPNAAESPINVKRKHSLNSAQDYSQEHEDHSRENEHPRMMDVPRKHHAAAPVLPIPREPAPPTIIKRELMSPESKANQARDKKNFGLLGGRFVPKKK